LDAFTKAVILTTILTIAVFGAIIFIAIDNLDKIPSIETGALLSKQTFPDATQADYTITLSDQRTLYILNDSLLYSSLQENQTYVFTCHLDFNRKMAFIVDASEK
jgi:hypothetical protein